MPESGQEELYVALQGSGWVGIGDGEARLGLDPERCVFVEPQHQRELSITARPGTKVAARHRVRIR